MNTAAPNPSCHTRQPHSQDASTYVKSDAYASERISAQEAMKDMRISESHQINHRKSDIDDTHAASRVDRHLAGRAQTVRESSRSYTEKEASLKVASVEHKRSSPENTSEVHAPDTPTLIVIPKSSTKSDTNDFDSCHQTTQTCAQGSSVPPDQGSHSAPTNQFHNQKAPIRPPSPTSPNSDNCSAPPPPPSSERQSRLSSGVSSSKDSYRRKYGEIQGYTYTGTIGQGNFGKVLLAEDNITGEKVAVKILEKAQFKSEQQRLHATREARLMATLRHPYIVDVKTVMEDDNRILIVMENLTGGELFDYISNKGALDEREARRIFHQIVLAIHYCHENNVVHRDLKPENILLDSERNVRVADFGFGNNWYKDRHLTTYCGSPFYAAPEMVSGTPYTGPETDVWSLGVILYVLVCGRLPFDASDLPALFTQIKRGNYQKPREGSIDVCSLIHRMLTVDPKRRATLTDVLRSRWMRADGLEPMFIGLPTSTAPSTIRSASIRTQQSTKPTTLATHHPNQDISATMAAPAVKTSHHRHSYHPPGTDETNQYQPHPKPQPQTPQRPVRELRYNDSDDQMSDVSPSMSNSPTETLATISPSTTVGLSSKEDALSAAGASVSGTPSLFQKRPSGCVTGAYDDKHHPYKHHSRTTTVQCHGQGPENVIIVCPSSDALVDGLDTSLKKKRKALTKLRQFFRLETNKC
ncbi:NUAK SNF1-like kinase 2 [Mortierella sp. NVP85]|nr:NUAK SNF1-like kinase 2 [Mortierella sp. NVP85]